MKHSIPTPFPSLAASLQGGLMALSLMCVTSCRVLNVIPMRSFSKSETVVQLSGDKKGPRRLMIFFDGTANKWETRTNVRRLFELAASTGDPKQLCFYHEGVGSRDTNLAGIAVGNGLGPRAGRAYDFIAEHYQEGDQIYIFGFSRGALLARSLAGMLAYAGLGKSNGQPIGRKVWDAVKALEEIDFCKEQDWEQLIKSPRCSVWKRIPHQGGVKSVPIQFVGVFDTVPALLGGWAYNDDGKPVNKKGEIQSGKGRPKILAYPTIRTIAHAVSIHEKRGPFIHALVGQAYDSSRTRVIEVWFPGDHSDIGGGHHDKQGHLEASLSGVTLNWMLDQLRPHQIQGLKDAEVWCDPKGEVHKLPLGPIPRFMASLLGIHAPSTSPRSEPVGAVEHPSARLHPKPCGMCPDTHVKCGCKR